MDVDALTLGVDQVRSGSSRARVLVSVGVVLAAGCGAPRKGPEVADCSSLADDYASALPDAQLCDPARPGTCEATRPASLSACCCTLHVNPARTARLDAIIEQFGLQECVPSGPRVTCTDLSWACQPTSSGTQVCTGVPLGATP